MRSKLQQAFDLEMSKAIKLYETNLLTQSFFHLERAHILGQTRIIPHTRSHWWMLKVAVKHRDAHELMGQITRIIASLIFTRIWVPIGNTGGANVNPLKPMPIPDDLQAFMNES